MARVGLFEGSKRKSYGEASFKSGGASMRYSTGAQDQSAERLTATPRGGYAPTVRMPTSPIPVKGERPLASRVGAIHSGLTHPRSERARVGNVHDPGGTTLMAEAHMATRRNAGRRTPLAGAAKAKR